MVSFVGALVFVFSLLPALVFFSFAQLCHLRREFFFVFFGRLFPVTKGVVSYYFRSIRFFFSSDFLRRLLNLVICIICLSGSSVCVWISVYLALFPPTRDLYRISIHSHFVKFLTDAAGFGIWHHLLITKFCVSSNLGFVLVLFPPTRDLYWISVHSRLVRFLTDASGFDILHHLFSISVSLWISAVFCPLSGNKGLTLHFDPFSLS